MNGDREHMSHNRRSSASHRMSTLSDESRTTSSSSSSSSLDLKTPPITSTTFHQRIYISSTSSRTPRERIPIPHSPSPSNPHALSHPYFEEMVLPKPGTSDHHSEPQSHDQLSSSSNPLPSTVSHVSVDTRRRDTAEELRPHRRPIVCFKRSLSEKIAHRTSNSHLQQPSPPPVPELPSRYVKSNKMLHTASTKSDSSSRTLRKATSTSRITTKCSSHSASLSKRRSQPLRTQPYEAPYFFPQPGTAAAAEYVPTRAKPTRSQTLPPKTGTS